jgi:hypothetical protein
MRDHLSRVLEVQMMAWSQNTWKASWAQEGGSQDSPLVTDWNILSPALAFCLDCCRHILSSLPASPSTFLQPSLHPAARKNIFRCKSNHIATPPKLHWFPTTLTLCPQPPSWLSSSYNQINPHTFPLSLPLTLPLFHFFSLFLFLSLSSLFNVCHFTPNMPASFRSPNQLDLFLLERDCFEFIVPQLGTHTNISLLPQMCRLPDQLLIILPCLSSLTQAK